MKKATSRGGRGTRLLLVLASALLLALAAFDGVVDILARPFGGLGANGSIVARGLLAVVGLGTLLLLRFADKAGFDWAMSDHSRLNAQLASEKLGNPLRQYTSSQITSMVSTSSTTKERVEAHASLVGGLCGRATHVHESYQLLNGSMVRKVSSHYDLSKKLREILGSATTIPFPVMTVLKGYLPDGLTVSLADGRALPVTPYATTLHLQLLTLQTLYREAMGPTGDRDRFSALCYQIARLGPLKEPSPVYLPMEALDLELDAEFALRRPAATNKERATLARLKQFVRTYSDAYPICVEIGRDDLKGHLTLDIEQTTRIYEATDGWRDKSREWLGLSPFKFRLPIVLPYLATSYHLVFEADPSTYLFSQHVEDETHARILPEQLTAPVGNEEPAYVRLKGSSPSSMSHLYMRGFQSKPARPLSALVRFHERPPGALGGVTVLIGALAVALYTMGYLAGLKSAEGSVDVVALLVAVPGIAGVILGGTSFSTPYTSLTARLALIATIGLSATGVLLYGAQEKGALFLGEVAPSVLGVSIPVHDVSWVILISLAVGLFLYLLVVHVTWASSYHQRAHLPLGAADRDAVPGIQPSPDGLRFASDSAGDQQPPGPEGGSQDDVAKGLRRLNGADDRATPDHDSRNSHAGPEPGSNVLRGSAADPSRLAGDASGDPSAPDAGKK